MKSKLTFATTAASLGAALALAGCGGGASPLATAKPTNALVSAYTHTVSTDSARMTLQEVVKTGSAQETVSGTGTVDLKGKDGEFTLKLPQVGSITVRTIVPELYMEFPPALRSEISRGKPWASINLNELTKAKLGASLAQLSSSSQASTQALSYLDSVSNSGVHRLGVRKVGGVKTTEYAATVSLTKAIARAGSQERAAVKKLEGQLHSSTLPMHVWIDNQNRVRQLSYQMSVTESGQTATVALTIGFSDFGVHVDVKAPPAGQVDNITKQIVANTPG